MKETLTEEKSDIGDCQSNETPGEIKKISVDISVPDNEKTISEICIPPTPSRCNI